MIFYGGGDRITGRIAFGGGVVRDCGVRGRSATFILAVEEGCGGGICVFVWRFGFKFATEKEAAKRSACMFLVLMSK